MKLAIILILGMVSCFEIGQADDGASVIRRLLSRVRYRIKRLNLCGPMLAAVNPELINYKTINIISVGNMIRECLEDIEANINSRPLLLRPRSQHCYTNAQNELDLQQLTTLQKLEACVPIGQLTINTTPVIQEANALIAKLKACRSNSATNNIQEAHQHFDSFIMKAKSTYDECTKLSKSVRKEAKSCFEMVLGIFHLQVNKAYHDGLKCIKLVTYEEQ